MTQPDLKTRTARSLKWNLIDKVSAQILYAVTGIILARVLSQEDFGLVGAILVFQAFAALLVESGFASALIQKQSPDDEDYSTVLWFNIGVAVFLYSLLYLCAPLIALCFSNNQQLIPLSRVMFLSLILNAAGIVQTNRLMKQMNVRPIAATNAAGLAAGGITGIYLALSGYGAWAIVWQTIITAGVKTSLLWIWVGWLPKAVFSVNRLRSFFKVGNGVLFQSFLNTIFLNIYAFFIGNRAGLVSLGYYTQADKWSKMGIMSLTQTLTSTFLPTLSAVQDSAERFIRSALKMNRLTAYLLFPFVILLSIAAPQIFHILFGEKWDASILLFRLLLARGIFTVHCGLCNNILLSIAKTAEIVRLEIIRDTVSLIFLFITLPVISLTTPTDPVYGITLLLYGQLTASFITWIFTIIRTAHFTPLTIKELLTGLLPYFLLSLTAGGVSVFPSIYISDPWSCLAVQGVLFLFVYMGGNTMLGSKIQSEALGFIFRRNSKNTGVAE